MRNSPASSRVRLEGGEEEEELLVPEQRFPHSPWRGQAGTGEQHEEEGAVERSRHGLTPSPHSPSPCAT